ncbi:hypothetical protein DEGR_33460 (plasmid) [Deinococcus grandis]|nr:hypothetical protein DEGR_33460 [Deinococcus grandis]
MGSGARAGREARSPVRARVRRGGRRAGLGRGGQERQRERADLDLVAGFQAARFVRREAVAVDERDVLAAREVRQEQRAALGADLGVADGDRRVPQRQPVVGRAADGQGAGQRQDPQHLAPPADLQRGAHTDSD